MVLPLSLALWLQPAYWSSRLYAWADTGVACKNAVSAAPVLPAKTTRFPALRRSQTAPSETGETPFVRTDRGRMSRDLLTVLPTCAMLAMG